MCPGHRKAKLSGTLRIVRERRFRCGITITPGLQCSDCRREKCECCPDQTAGHTTVVGTTSNIPAGTYNSSERLQGHGYGDCSFQVKQNASIDCGPRLGKAGKIAMPLSESGDEIREANSQRKFGGTSAGATEQQSQFFPHQAFLLILVHSDDSSWVLADIFLETTRWANHSRTSRRRGRSIRTTASSINL